MAIPSFKEVEAYLALGLYSKRLYPNGVKWTSTKSFRKYAANFELDENGILFLVDGNHKTQILDNNLSKIVAFKKAHCDQHQSYKHTCALIAKQYFWFGMEKDIQIWINDCKICQEKKRQQDSCEKALLLDHPYSLPGKLNINHLDQGNETFDCNKNFLTTLHEFQNPTLLTSTNLIESNWDHDYIADKLTLQRKVHSLLDSKDSTEDNDQIFTDNLKENANSHALQCTLWDPVRFKVDYNEDLLPDRDDSSFLALFGLETVANYLNNEELGLETLPERRFVSPATCSKCGTDMSSIWYKWNTNQWICTLCRKMIFCKSNTASAHKAFSDYRSRYNSNFKEMDETLLKKKQHLKPVIGLEAKPVIGLEAVVKRTEALSHLSKMRKLAMFKANLVTKSLLKHKGVKTINIKSEKLFTENIRRIMSDPSNRPLQTPDNTDNVVKALTQKRTLQEYLQSRLEQHKSFLKKQLKLPSVQLKQVRLNNRINPKTEKLKTMQASTSAPLSTLQQLSLPRHHPQLSNTRKGVIYTLKLTKSSKQN